MGFHGVQKNSCTLVSAHRCKRLSENAFAVISLERSVSTLAMRDTKSSLLVLRQISPTQEQAQHANPDQQERECLRFRNNDGRQRGSFIVHVYGMRPSNIFQAALPESLGPYRRNREEIEFVKSLARTCV